MTSEDMAMPSPLDDQITRVFDALADQVRDAVAAHAATATEQLAAAVAESQAGAVAAAAHDAAATAERDVNARLQLEFAHREFEVREQARRAGYEEGREDARAEALAAQDAHDAVMRAAQEAAAQAAAMHAAELASAASAHAAELAAATAAHAQTARGTREALSRLLRAVRALDASTSLSQTLDALAVAAQGEAGRVAVFLVRGDALRAWAQSGFDMLAGQAADIPLADAGVVADAVRTSTARRTAVAHERPAFAGAYDGGGFVAVPLAMNGQVIAVLCGDEPTAMDDGEWLAGTYEVLARHAARGLESLTALRLAQVGAPAGARA